MARRRPRAPAPAPRPSGAGPAPARRWRGRRRGPGSRPKPGRSGASTRCPAAASGGPVPVPVVGGDAQAVHQHHARAAARLAVAHAPAADRHPLGSPPTRAAAASERAPGAIALSVQPSLRRRKRSSSRLKSAGRSTIGLCDAPRAARPAASSGIAWRISHASASGTRRVALPPDEQRRRAGCAGGAGARRRAGCGAIACAMRRRPGASGRRARSPGGTRVAPAPERARSRPRSAAAAAARAGAGCPPASTSTRRSTRSGRARRQVDGELPAHRVADQVGAVDPDRVQPLASSRPPRRRGRAAGAEAGGVRPKPTRSGMRTRCRGREPGTFR